jgi:ATP-dependent DNA helicase DinG
VIFDEAHHLPRVATESLGLRIGRGSVAWHLQRLRPRRSRHGLLDRHGSPGALRLVDELRDAANCFFQDLDQRIAKAGGSALALGDERLRDPLSGGLRELADELIGSATAVESIDLRMEIQARARGLAALQAVLHTLCQPTDRTRVRWLEPTRTGTELRAAPLEVGEALRQFVFVPGRTAVLTSATLGPGNDPTFAWIRDQLGLTDIDCLRLGSPFDYRRLVRLSLEEAMPDPGGDPSGFARACRERIPPLVIQNGGRALILCTSWTSVRDIAAALREPLAEEGIPLLVQGEAPLRHLLERKRGEPTSVLVGTDSLWEGIDVPGEALTLLVVTRFPFAQPDHPLTRARLRAIEARGGSGFADHTLPEAVLKFRQGFGRLVRTATDRGTVVVMDPRARTRAYGRQFLTALPDGVTPVGVEEPTGSE